MANINELRIPRTKGRLASTITLKAGIDTASTIPLLNAIDPNMADLAQSALNAAQAISVVTGQGGKTSSVAAAASQAFAKLGDIGNVESFSSNPVREVYRQYALGRYSFEPRQIMPLSIKNEISLRKVILYSMSDAERTFGFLSDNLMFQVLPFLIQQEEYSPGGWRDQQEGFVGTPELAKASQKVYTPGGEYPELTRVTIYCDCWMLSSEIKYDITAADQLVVQDMKIACGHVMTFDDSIPSKTLIALEGAGSAIQTVSLMTSMKLPQF